MVESSGDDRPSSARRKHLREADANSGTVPMVSNFFPLERYYEASDKVLDSFVTAFEKRRLDEAYVYGMRYCTFCVDGLVKHDYYRSSKFNQRRIQTNERVKVVLTKLEMVAEWMDVEEKEKEEKRRAIILKQQQERLRKQREQEKQRIEQLQKRIEQQKLSSSVSELSVQESALAKLQRLSQPTPTAEQLKIGKKVSFQTEENQLEPDGHHADSPTNGLPLSSVQPLPPPLPPPSTDGEAAVPANVNAPPSYNQIIAGNSYFGPGSSSATGATPQPALPAPSYDAIVKNKTQPAKPKRLSIRQYISRSKTLYVQLQQERKIVRSGLKTYQGRVGGSTNGCTVISACVVSKHLETHGGVTDLHAASIIDSECVPLLRKIRSRVGLDGSALIIPSDVHDYMVDHKLLFQHKFVGVAGGNIVDPKHLGELLSLLVGEPGKTQHLKAGATLFFREHVVSIVKFPTSPTEAVYDMIDSLPVCNGKACRTRCMSFDALKVLLQWYSCHKFSDANCTYIERNRWDDSMADFDPRVFQAFVWADIPEPKN